MREIDFLDPISGSEEVEEDHLVRSFLAEFEVIIGELSIWYRSSPVHRARSIRWSERTGYR